MAYKIIDIEGVGEVYAPKLIAAGINTPEDLLEKCAAPAGRKALAEETGMTDGQVRIRLHRIRKRLRQGDDR